MSQKTIVSLLSGALVFFLSTFSLTIQAYSAGGLGQRNFGAKGLTFSCPPKSVPIGLTVNAGTFVHAVRLICAVISKGKLTTQLKESRIHGTALSAGSGQEKPWVWRKQGPLR